MENYQEKNREVLLEGIRSLPKYEPPIDLWNAIEIQLENREHYQRAINTLPQYSAPTKVWEQLEIALDKANPQSRSTPIRRLFSRRYQWAAAAVAGGLIICAWLLFQADPAATTSIVYSEERLTAPPVEMDWGNEESSFAMVLQQVDQSPVADPHTIQRLKMEYHELTDAREEVAQMIQRYGEDADMLKEIARIERERSKVIKELAAWI
ncbi:MAG: hypothetical protein R2824_06640 [Saprospiraceae bacterium]|nr:hypothetical protein [Lewinella sp.]